MKVHISDVKPFLHSCPEIANVIKIRTFGNVPVKNMPATTMLAERASEVWGGELKRK